MMFSQYIVLMLLLQKTLKTAHSLKFSKRQTIDIMEKAYSLLFIITLIFLAIASLVAMIRSITGKDMVNRFIGINILTTIVAIGICVLTLFLKESFLADVAIIYVLLSCLSVLILCRIYINLFLRKEDERKGESDDN